MRDQRREEGRERDALFVDGNDDVLLLEEVELGSPLLDTQIHVGTAKDDRLARGEEGAGGNWDLLVTSRLFRRDLLVEEGVEDVDALEQSRIRRLDTNHHSSAARRQRLEICKSGEGETNLSP